MMAKYILDPSKEKKDPIQTDVSELLKRYVTHLRKMSLIDNKTLISAVEQYEKDENSEHISLYSRWATIKQSIYLKKIEK